MRPSRASAPGTGPSPAAGFAIPVPLLPCCAPSVGIFCCSSDIVYQPPEQNNVLRTVYYVLRKRVNNTQYAIRLSASLAAIQLAEQVAHHRRDIADGRDGAWVGHAGRP